MNNADAGTPATPMRLWLHPWAWILAGLAATAGALIWARACSTDEVPLDLVQVNLVGLGVLAAGAAVWLRCARHQGPGLDAIPQPLRGRLLVALALIHAGIAVAVTAVAVVRFNRPDLPGDTVGTILLWLVSVPWCAWASWQLLQRIKGGAALGERFETAILVTLAGLAAFMGSWAFWWGPEYGDEWDSLRLFLAVAAALCFLAAPLVAASTPVRRLGVSALILFHFGAVLSVVIGAPPGPWIVAQSQHWIFRPYLDFMYLNNAYRFYSPEPSPASQVWFRVEYEPVDGKKKDVRSRWVKLPDMDEQGNHKYPVSLQFTRRLALTEYVARTDPMPPMQITLPDGRMQIAPFVQRRNDQLPKKMIDWPLGHKLPEKSLEVPLHPEAALNYQQPTSMGRQLVSSYARHVLRQPPPSDLAGYKPVRVKVYRVQHRILLAETMAMGADPRDWTFYLPYYVGQFDSEGRLLDPDDPFLYWVLPILRENPNDPKSPLQFYVYKHAGDVKDFVKQAPLLGGAP